MSEEPELEIIEKICDPVVYAGPMLPGRGASNFADQMRLSGSTEQRNVYYETVETIARLCDRLNPAQKGDSGSRSRRGASCMRWSRFIKIVRRKCPIIDGYENFWPVKVIVSRHRKRRSSSQSRVGLINWTKYMEYEKSQTGSMYVRPSTLSAVSDPEPQDRSKTVSMSGRASSRISSHSFSSVSMGQYNSTPSRSLRPATTGRRDQTSSQRTTQSRGSMPLYYRSISVETNTYYCGRTTRNVQPEDEDILPIVLFLTGLVPEQSDCLQTFLSMGINSGAVLEGLARMQTRDRWVYSWVKEGRITEFQFGVIIEGLKVMLD